MPPQAFDVVGIGENSVDLVYRLAAAPHAGAKLEALDHRVSCGGQVATTLATCAALGLRTAYVGAFGDDAHGARVRDALDHRGVNTRHAAVRPCPNRHAVILVDGAGERTVVAMRDGRLALAEHEIPPHIVAHARLLHVDATEPDAALAAVRIARQHGVPVTCDIDEASAHARELLRQVTHPILAEAVPAALTGEADPERALLALREQHAGWLCVTLGARGALLLEGDRLHRAAAPVVEAVDTTGAGDVFRGAFIYALLRGDTPDRVLRFATAAAALSCTREGAIDGVPTRDEMERLQA